MHENFSMPSAANDIGIIELPERLNFSESIQPLEISTQPNVDLDETDTQVVIAGWNFIHTLFNLILNWEFIEGWGFTHDNSGPADKLLYTRMKLITIHECFNYRQHYYEEMTENHICTKHVDGGPCDGRYLWLKNVDYEYEFFFLQVIPVHQLSRLKQIKSLEL